MPDSVPNRLILIKPWQRRFDDPALSSVLVYGTATVLPIPEVIKVDPQQKVFKYRSWYYTAIDRILGDQRLVHIFTHKL